MAEIALTYDRSLADREKRGVALSSLLAAVVLASTKLGVGLWTNSLGILSEAAHSGLDLVAAGVTLWAVRIASLPADHDHTYGHGKFENLSALIETLLLLATCAWVIYEAARRLFAGGHAEVDASVWAFAVVIGSIVIDYSRSRALMRVARKYGSQALEADALHFATDIWSSVVVLFGLLGVRVAQSFHWPWLEKADAVAALGVAVIVIHVGIALGKRSIDDLLDKVPPNLRDDVARAVARVAGVKDVKQVRVRRSGPEVFADVTITVDHAAAFEGAHDVADRTESAVRALAPAADVMVHVEPAADRSDDATTTVRLLAARHGLGAHSIRMYQERNQRSLELHLEVDGTLTLDEAHRQATAFEQALHEAMPGLKRIETHIEPAGDQTALLYAEPAAAAAEVDTAIRRYMQSTHLVDRPHEINAQWANGELNVSFHCVLPAHASITEAHALTQHLEAFLREQVPNLGRVLIHAEPGDLNSTTDRPGRA